jgi:hypothetical protein
MGGEATRSRWGKWFAPAWVRERTREIDDAIRHALDLLAQGQPSPLPHGAWLAVPTSSPMYRALWAAFTGPGEGRAREPPHRRRPRGPAMAEAAVLRVRIASRDAESGQLSLTADVMLRGGVRRALLASACSVINPLAAHPHEPRLGRRHARGLPRRPDRGRPNRARPT